MRHARSQANKLAECLRALPAAPAADRLLNKNAMVSCLRAEIIGLQEVVRQAGQTCLSTVDGKRRVNFTRAAKKQLRKCASKVSRVLP